MCGHLPENFRFPCSLPVDDFTTPEENETSIASSDINLFSFHLFHDRKENNGESSGNRAKAVGRPASIDDPG